MRKCDCHNEVVGARASAPQEEAVKATYCNLFRGTPCKPRERVEIKYLIHQAGARQGEFQAPSKLPEENLLHPTPPAPVPVPVLYVPVL